MNINIVPIIEIAQQAGQLVLAIYNQPSIETAFKSDQSPLTKADTESHLYIQAALTRLHPAISVLSEEAEEFHHYDARKHWDYFFLVDPLDGTKEFINRNGEFTINIALIKKNKPVLGVIHAPALSVTYFAEENKGAYKIANNHTHRLEPNKSKTHPLRIVASRSHRCAQTEAFVNSFTEKADVISAGSALKFGLVAEGKADIYPRFSPTMEWDTAAGHVLVTETGKRVRLCDRNEPLLYNKSDLRNPGFVVE